MPLEAMYDLHAGNGPFTLDVDTELKFMAAPQSSVYVLLKVTFLGSLCFAKMVSVVKCNKVHLLQCPFSAA